MHQQVEEDQANQRLERLDSLVFTESDDTSAAWQAMLGREPLTWTIEEINPLLMKCR